MQDTVLEVYAGYSTGVGVSGHPKRIYYASTHVFYHCLPLIEKNYCCYVCRIKSTRVGISGHPQRIYYASDMACAHIETCCIKARCGYTSSYRRGCVQLMLSLNFHNKTCVFIYHGFSSYKTKHFQMLFFHFLPTLLNLILTYVEMVPVCV